MERKASIIHYNWKILLIYLTFFLVVVVRLWYNGRFGKYHTWHRKIIYRGIVDYCSHTAVGFFSIYWPKSL